MSENRAYIIFDSCRILTSSADSGFSIAGIFENIGKTPAYDLIIHLDYRFNISKNYFNTDTLENAKYPFPAT